METQAAKKASRPALGRGLSSLISGGMAVPVNPPSVAREVAAAAAVAAAQQSATTSSAVREKVIEVRLSEPRLEPATEAAKAVEGVSYVAIEKLFNNPKQPRQFFKESELVELASSIKTHGVLQPVLVRPGPDGKFEIIAGERRWRASKLAALEKVPVIIKDFDDKDTLKISIVENVQRSNLTPLEEGRAYQRLVDEFSLSQQEVAETVGKDRATVANFLRLLKLPEQVREMLDEGKLSMGHAKAILSVREPAAQLNLAKKVINENLSVRSLEQIVSRVVVLDSGKPDKSSGTSYGEPQKPVSAESQPFAVVVDRLRNVLGTKVKITHQASGRGKVEIEYFSEPELDRIVEKICAE